MRSGNPQSKQRRCFSLWTGEWGIFSTLVVAVLVPSVRGRKMWLFKTAVVELQHGIISQFTFHSLSLSPPLFMGC